MHTFKWFQVLLFNTNNSSKYQSFVYTQFNDQTVLFQTIQFSISHLFAHSLIVKQFYRTLSAATTPGQSGPWSNGNKGVLHISQSFRITGASPLDCLVSYPWHLLVESYSSADIQSVNSTAPAKCTNLNTKKKHIVAVLVL